VDASVNKPNSFEKKLKLNFARLLNWSHTSTCMHVYVL